VNDKTKKRIDDATLSAVTKEMAKPRLAASVRKAVAKTAINSQAKFSIGTILHNRNTKEDGLVKRVYQVGGSMMYEVSVPATPNTYYVSDWGESALELSNYKPLMSLDKPPRDWPYEK
jgi:hypothetical protein